MDPGTPHELRTALFHELDAATLYEILKLRSDVFVVKQRCCYADPDGRDTEPGTRHVWLSDSGRVGAYLRLLDEGTAYRIGRVVTAPEDRGAGLAGRLMTEAVRIIGDRPCILDAQAYLVGFYAGFGFAPTGPEFLEDGIPHVPMARTPHAH